MERHQTLTDLFDFLVKEDHAIFYAKKLEWKFGFLITNEKAGTVDICRPEQAYPDSRLRLTSGRARACYFLERLRVALKKELEQYRLRYFDNHDYLKLKKLTSKAEKAVNQEISICLEGCYHGKSCFPA